MAAKIYSKHKFWPCYYTKHLKMQVRYVKMLKLCAFLTFIVEYSRPKKCLINLCPKPNQLILNLVATLYVLTSG